MWGRQGRHGRRRGGSRQVGEVVSVHVIPRPHQDVEQILPDNGNGDGKSGSDAKTAIGQASSRLTTAE